MEELILNELKEIRKEIEKAREEIEKLKEEIKVDLMTILNACFLAK